MKSSPAAAWLVDHCGGRFATHDRPHECLFTTIVSGAVDGTRGEDIALAPGVRDHQRRVGLESVAKAALPLQLRVVSGDDVGVKVKRVAIMHQRLDQDGAVRRKRIAANVESEPNPWTARGSVPSWSAASGSIRSTTPLPGHPGTAVLPACSIRTPGQSALDELGDAMRYHRAPDKIGPIVVREIVIPDIVVLADGKRAGSSVAQRDPSPVR